VVVSTKVEEKDKVFFFGEGKPYPKTQTLIEQPREYQQPYSREAAGKKPDRSQRPVRFQPATNTKNTCPAQANKAGAKPERPYE